MQQTSASKNNVFIDWINRHITLHEHDSPKEEAANAATHGIGAVLAAAAFIISLILFRKTQPQSLAWGMVIFTFSMVLLYTASSLYHLLPRNVWKRLCRILDHSNIYILIAGTYTPILLAVNTERSRGILLLVWGIAAAGIVFTLLFWGRWGAVHVLLYLLMGWMIVFFWDEIVPFLTRGLLMWILAGGITYTLGVIFYASKRLPYYHAVWHVFVLGGSACFYAGFVLHLL